MVKKPALDPVRKLLVDALGQRDLTKKAASKLIGKNESYLQQYIERGVPRRLPEDVRESLARVLHVPADVLKGAKLDAASESGAIESDHVLIDDQPRERSLSITVPELDVRGEMGGGALVDTEDRVASWEIPTDLLRGHTTAPLGGLVVIRATGDSMAPEIPPGTRVMVDPSDTRPSPPGIFAVWDGIGLVIKRVEYLMHSDPPTIRLMSANPAYQTYERSLEEAQIKGRVIGRWSWV